MRRYADEHNVDARALLNVLGGWIEGNYATDKKLEQALGINAYAVYRQEIEYADLGVDELYGLEERTSTHTKFANAIRRYNLDAGRVKAGKDGHVPIELVELILNEMTDDERRHLNDSYITYDEERQDYGFDEQWWHENRDRTIFKTGDLRRRVEKRTTALMAATEAYLEVGIKKGSESAIDINKLKEKLAQLRS